MSVFNSPAVKTTVTDYSGYISSSAPTVVGMVGGATMGPPNVPTLTTSETQYVKTFGSPALTNNGQGAAVQFLKQGNQLWYTRITDGTDTTATIAVLDSVSTPPDSFVVNGAYTGSGYNGYQVVVSNVVSTTTPATFTVQLLDPSGKSVFIFNNATMSSANANPNYLPLLVNGNGYPVSITDPNNGTGSIPVANTYTLAGGTDGTGSITDADVIGTGVTGMQGFTNADLYPITVLCAPGFSDNAVIQAGISLCSTRGDCIYLVDTPQGLSVAEVIQWSNGTGPYASTMTAVSSQYAAIYWPWVQYYDPYNAINRWSPPSGWISGVYAYNDSVGYPWTAPAGLNRGRLTLPIGIEYSASQADRDNLQGNGNVINPIVNFSGVGLVVWGQKTSLRQTSDQNRVNVIRLLANVRKAIAASSLFLTFENNNQVLWNEWLGLVRPYLNQIQSEGGFYSYSVTMDSSLVTPADIQEHYLPGTVSIQPQLDAEYINIGFILLPTGATFQ